MNRKAQIFRATWVSVFVNAFLAIIKIILGFIGQSPALFADGMHSLADMLADALVFVAAHYGSIAPDANHPYGHRRIETFSAYLLGVLLFILGLYIAYSGIHTIWVGHYQTPAFYTAIVAFISLLANEGLYRYLMFWAKKSQSDLVEANAWHNRLDALTSLVVLVGIIGARFGYPALDPIAAI